MKISIIIPAFNEEKYLPLLLKSIEKQSFKDYEVIVADAASKDNTAEIAGKFGATVVKGGMPAKGRNSGARAAHGEFLFFLDADVILPDDFLEKAYAEIQKRYLDLATCEIIPLSDLYIDKVMHSLVNLSIRINQYATPHAGGVCILTTRRLFDITGGFDESLTLAEDHNFVKRASKYRPLRVLESTHISVSIRRLEKEGRSALVSKYLQVELYRIFKGEIKTNVVDYEFGNFQKHSPEKQLRLLTALEKQLVSMDKKFSSMKNRHKSEQASEAMPAISEKFREQFEKVKVFLSELLEIM